MIIKDKLFELFSLNVSNSTLDKLESWKTMFIEYNSHTNLMSKNDIKVLYEKHVIDSLSVCLFSEFNKNKVVLDVGCGGGFPSLILSVFFPDIKIYALDSTGKKIKFIENAKCALSLDNLYPITGRAETVDIINADIILNRAVGKIGDVYKLSDRHLKKGGYFISYKSKNVEEELNYAIKKYPNLSFYKLIPYKLPLPENYTRELVIMKKN